MKTITILLISLLNFSTYVGFADTLESNSNCCPAQAGMSSDASRQNQLMLLDQLQQESENLILPGVELNHAQINKQVMVRSEQHAVMNSIQLETEQISVAPLQGIAEKVKAHLAGHTATAIK